MGQDSPPDGSRRDGDRERIAADVVGREREIELILAAVNSGRDLLLEGAPGTSKTTLLKAITAEWGIPLILAEGNAELTPGRLLGHHDPARVLQEGYSEDTFDPGPLVEAMRLGGFLYLEEFNRAPEDTLNTLLTAIGDRKVTIPRVGTIEAQPGFRLIGSMNPFDNVGTTRLSVSIKDRLNRLVIDYQDANAEREVVRRRCAEIPEATVSERIVADSVAVTRATRSHDAVAQGSSVRGAIDLALMTAELGRLRRLDADDEDAYRQAFWETMVVALSGRLSIDHASELDETMALREIWESHFVLSGRTAGPGENATGLGRSDASRPASDASDRAKRPVRVKPKALDQEAEMFTAGGGGGLATAPMRDPRLRPGRRSGSSVFSEESGELDEEGEPAGPELAVRARAKDIAARLALQDPLQHRRSRRGGAEVLSAPYRGDGEVDLDRTLDALVEHRTLAKEEVVVRERRRTKRQIVLVVDVSGSMRGERLLTAAATVGALYSGLHRDDLAVIAFWSDAAVLVRLGERVGLERLLDELLGLEAAGLTNVSFPLSCAAKELGGGGNDVEQRVLLLSDCVHNAGPDPRAAAAGLPRLDVLFDVSGERDSELASDLARIGRGEVHSIRGHRNVAPALSRLFTRMD